MTAQYPTEYKVQLSPSPHYNLLVDGTTKYQKSRPRQPVWRFLIADEASELLHIRFFGLPPRSEILIESLVGFHSSCGDSGALMVIPASLSKQYPNLNYELDLAGVPTRAPDNPGDAGAHFGKRADRFLEELNSQLFQFDEGAVTYNELDALVRSGPFIIISAYAGRVDRPRLNPRDLYKLTFELAQVVCQARGRDPVKALSRHKRQPVGARRNSHDTTVPETDLVQLVLSGKPLPSRVKEYAPPESGLNELAARIDDCRSHLGTYVESDYLHHLGEFVGLLSFSEIGSQYPWRRFRRGFPGLEMLFGRESSATKLMEKALLVWLDGPLRVNSPDGFSPFFNYRAWCCRVEVSRKRKGAWGPRYLPRHKDLSYALSFAIPGADFVVADHRMASKSEHSFGPFYFAQEVFDRIGEAHAVDGFHRNETNFPKSTVMGKPDQQCSEISYLYVLAGSIRPFGLVMDEVGESLAACSEIANEWLEKWGCSSRMKFSQMLPLSSAYNQLNSGE